MTGAVRAVAYAAGRPVGEVALEAVGPLLAARPDVFLWVALREPDAPELRQVQQAFGLHDLAVEDALRAHQRPKLERYGDALFVVLRTARRPEGPDGRIAFGELHLFVGPRAVVAVQHGAAELPESRARARWEAAPAELAHGPGLVLYVLMDLVVDDYFPVVDALEAELEALEEAIFSAALRRTTAERIYRLRRDLLELKRCVSPLVDLANRLQGGEVPLVAEALRVYFRDVFDHALRINEMVDMLRELLTTALEASLALVTVAQNEAMKRLAGWGAIVAVPTMIAGIYGMNFRVMPELEWRFGYPAVMAVMLGVCLFLYRRFRRAGWL